MLFSRGAHSLGDADPRRRPTLSTGKMCTEWLDPIPSQCLHRSPGTYRTTAPKRPVLRGVDDNFGAGMLTCHAGRHQEQRAKTERCKNSEAPRALSASRHHGAKIQTS